MDIRRAVEADVASVRAVVDAAYAGHVPRIGRPPAPMTADYETLVAAGDVWVRDADGRVVGVLVIRASGDALELENVAVDPAAQGLGHGRALVSFAETRARDLGLGAVELYTNEAMVENLALYPKLGFVETERRVEDGFRRSTSGRPWTPGNFGVSLDRRMRLRKGLTGFIIRRLLLGLVTLWITSVIIFAATQALPGDAARSILGRSATPESLATLRAQLGLDEPVLTQYWEWISGVFTGDLGTSLANSLPVTDVVGERLVYTLFLLLIAGAISIPFGIFLGAISARKRDSAFDQTTSIATLGLVALPEFVVGITLAVIFSTTVFHVLPSVIVTEPGSRPWEYPKELVLPLITLIIAVVPYTARIMRASTVEILESDYVEMARLKGLSERRVLWRHAVPNALAPTFQVAALNLAYLAGGIVVVEAVFNYPGIGLLLVESVRARDMPTVQAIALFIAALYVVLNLLADVATILVSPRLRTSLQ